jgi:hypothetical protein
MHMVDVARMRANPKVWARYEALLGRADHAQHGSPDANALAAFQRDWANDPEAVRRAVEAGS